MNDLNYKNVIQVERMKIGPPRVPYCFLFFMEHVPVAGKAIFWCSSGGDFTFKENGGQKWMTSAALLVIRASPPTDSASPLS